MGRKKHALIAAVVMVMACFGALQTEAATTICHNCGGKGYTVIPIFYNQVINVMTGQSVMMRREDHIPCGTCGGTGRVYSGTSNSGNSRNSSSSSSNTGIGKTVKNGTVTDATDGIGYYEDAPNLLDGNVKTKFNVKATRMYIVWEAPKKIKVRSYTITTANDTSIYRGRNPKTWVLYGSNKKLSRNAKGWKKIHSVTNDKKLKPVNYKKYTYKLKKAAPAYKYFKLEIMANKGADCTQLSEFRLQGK